MLYLYLQIYNLIKEKKNMFLGELFQINNSKKLFNASWNSLDCYKKPEK